MKPLKEAITCQMKKKKFSTKTHLFKTKNLISHKIVLIQ